MQQLLSALIQRLTRETVVQRRISDDLLINPERLC